MAEVRGYNMIMGRELKKDGKTTDKAKNRLMSHVVIHKDGNRYRASGEDAETEQSMSVIMSAENANAAIESGHAKKGDGWD